MEKWIVFEYYKSWIKEAQGMSEEKLNTRPTVALTAGKGCNSSNDLKIFYHKSNYSGNQIKLIANPITEGYWRTVKWLETLHTDQCQWPIHWQIWNFLCKPYLIEWKVEKQGWYLTVGLGSHRFCREIPRLMHCAVLQTLVKNSTGNGAEGIICLAK